MPDSSPIPPSSAPRFGWCCQFVPPDGDAGLAKRMNPGTVTIATLSKLGPARAEEKLTEVLRRNLLALHLQLDEVARHPAYRRLLRVNSGLLPAYTHEVGRPLYRQPGIQALVQSGLEHAGRKAMEAGIRIGLHPDQYCVLNSANPSTLDNAVAELEYHADILRMMGLAGGWLLVAFINKANFETGLNPVVTLTFALFIFAATNVLGGSGYLAVYAAGLYAGNVKLRGALELRRFHSGLTWLSQIVMFVMLGLLATPRQFADMLLPALGVALVLIVVARPLAVWMCLLPFRFSVRETSFIAWVGLRGAVSLLLALVPVLGGLENGQLIFNTAFVVVVVSLLVQGWTIGSMARALELIVPPRRGPVERVELELPGNADQELVAYTVHGKSPAARGQRMPRWAKPSLVIRSGAVVPLHKAKPLQPGDHVYLFTPQHRLPLIDKLYGGSRALDQSDREFYGDLVLSPDATVEQIAEMYGLPLSLSNARLTLSDLLRNEFGGSCELGDRVRMGGVELIVRDMDEDTITSVGLALEPVRVTSRRRPLYQRITVLGSRLRGWWNEHAFRRWKERERLRAGRPAAARPAAQAGAEPQRPEQAREERVESRNEA